MSSCGSLGGHTSLGRSRYIQADDHIWGADKIKRQSHKYGLFVIYLLSMVRKFTLIVTITTFQLNLKDIHSIIVLKINVLDS